MVSIDRSDFTRFFEALYGYGPFPWQVRLAERVCDAGQFPDVLDLPTGAGKTACLDIALFHLAYDLSREVPRRAPLRIAWVVDRRLIVDDVFDRATIIAAKLSNASEGALKDVADALRSVAGEGAPPLVVDRLRGGIPREGDWARTPTQPTIISSTVDQVGSRLLFRGYGVSAQMCSIQAGLLGEDALIVLDEVHLSEPFRQTLDRIAGYERKTGVWRFAQLSATPRRKADRREVPFGLEAHDLADPTLRRRLEAAKPAELIGLGRLQLGSEEHADRFAREAIKRADLGSGEGKTVLVVVNRVALARRVHERLEHHLERDGSEVTITRLVGRGRDVDKETIRDEVVGRCKSDPSGRNQDEQRKPFFVVATQTIEAGADLDFDVLITQIAPLDALQQRFGRLNRMGRGIDARAAILAIDPEVLPSAKRDPIYGFALQSTWDWLEKHADPSVPKMFDFSTGRFLNVNADDVASLQAEQLDAPVLMPEHVKVFSRTSPVATWSPDPSLYLHGSPNSPADVNVVWRADIAQAPSLSGKALDDEVEKVTRLLSLVPPRMGEVVALPARVVRRWLRGEDTDDTADLESDIAMETNELKVKAKARNAWRWLGADADVELIENGRVKPGDTIVVSASIGGCDRFGWNPQSGTVVDVAEAAARPYIGRVYAVRLHRSLLLEDFGASRDIAGTDEAIQERISRAWGRISEIASSEQGGAKEVLNNLIGEEAQAGIRLPDPLKRSLESLQRARGRISIERPYSDEADEDDTRKGFVFFSRRGIRSVANEIGDTQGTRSESPTESDQIGAFGSGDPLSLIEHSEDVRKLAVAYARRLKLPKPLSEDLALAGFLHDVGKADHRFQHYLAGNTWTTATVLAKSGKRRSKPEDVRARKAADLPLAWRHEALSVRIARDHPDFAHAHDPELVLWLIGTHHGYGRPRFPHAEPRDELSVSLSGFMPFEQTPLELKPSPGPQRLDFLLQVRTGDGVTGVGWAEMFVRLEERYGHWGLARLESIVRLADHRASEAADEIKRTARR